MTSVCADLMQRDRVLDRGDGGDLIYPCSAFFCYCFFPSCLGHVYYCFSLFVPLLLLFFVVWAALVVFSLLVLLFNVQAVFFTICVQYGF